MHIRRGPFTRLAILVLCITSLSSVGPVTAQSTGSSDNTQLQMLQSLSPDQRDAIMNQMGVGNQGTGPASGMGGASGVGGLGTQVMPGRQRPTEEQEEQEADARIRDEEQRRFDEQRDLLYPFFKGDDWLIITIDAYPPQNNQPSQNPQ
jgi:hypothetical protein